MANINNVNLVQENSGIATPTARKCSSTSSRVFFVFQHGLANLITWLANFITGGYFSLKRVTAEVLTQNRNMEMEKVLVTHLKGALFPHLLDGADPFVQKVRALHAELAGVDRAHPPLRFSTHLYRKLETLLMGSDYEAFQRDHPEHQALKFLEDLGSRFYTCDMNVQMKEHSQKRLNRFIDSRRDSFHAKDVGDLLTQYNANYGQVRRDTSWQKISWALSFPDKGMQSHLSERSPEDYNASRNNPTYQIYQTSVNGRDLRFFAGPTPYNDIVYRTCFLKQNKELRFNLLDTNKKHENAMVRMMEEVAQNANGHLDHVLFGFTVKNKRGYSSKTRLDELIHDYKVHLIDAKRKSKIDAYKKDSGLLIPQHLITDAEIEEAASKTVALIQRTNPNLDLKNEKTRTAVLMILDTIIALYILKNQTQEIDGPINVSMACKQCYDRGPSAYVPLLLFMKGLEKEELTHEDLLELSALPIFRAPVSETREQLKEKFDVLHALTDILGENFSFIAETSRSIFSQNPARPKTAGFYAVAQSAFWSSLTRLCTFFGPSASSICS